MYKIILDNMSFPSLDYVLELLSTDFKLKFHFQTEISSVQWHDSMTMVDSSFPRFM